MVDKGKEINERYHVTDKVGRGILIGQSGVRYYYSYYRYGYYTCYYYCYGWSSSGLLLLRVLLVSGARRGLSYGSKRVWQARPLRWFSVRPFCGGKLWRRPFWRPPLPLNGNILIVGRNSNKGSTMNPLRRYSARMRTATRSYASHAR